MNKLNSIETQSNLGPLSLSDQTKFRLNEINKIKDYLNSEIQERKTIGKKLSNTLSLLIHKTLIVLSETSGRISIISFTLVFFLTTGIIKNLLKVTRKKKKKHDKTVMLAKSKLNGIEALMSQALIDLNTSHEEFKTIINEKEKYEQMKKSIKNTKKKDESSENSRDIRKNSKNTQT